MYRNGRKIINANDLIAYIKEYNLGNADIVFNVGDTKPYHVSDIIYDEQSNTIILM